jgi:tRNA 5-methylaminomethyl-2-thiouridine biosynthesis bifunctional protein
LTGEPLADRPQRDNGVYVPCYEDSGLAPAWPSRIWAMGSTYVRGDASTDITSDGHERNALSLQAMNAQASARLREAAAAQRLMGWAEVRCASLDRLPLVGAVPNNNALLRLKGTRRRHLPSLADAPREPGLYMLSAMGSRGITLAHWCAKLLASQLQGEPCNTDQDLVAAIDPARFAWRQARRSST